VARAIEVARTVEALGWDGACKVLDETWEGWEAEFLVDAVRGWLESSRAAREREQQRFWAQVIGGRRG